MAEFPFRLGKLSRFATAAEQRDVLVQLREGSVDIAIGTHRIASKDVVFHNLGLVIIDEEQRFGVGVKDRLKALRTSVNVLTLSATPIPRTLHMALTGHSRNLQPRNASGGAFVRGDACAALG